MKAAAALKTIDTLVEPAPLALVLRSKIHLVAPKLRCCGNGGKCANIVRFQIDAGYFCTKHSDHFWEEHFVDEHRVQRVGCAADDDDEF